MPYTAHITARARILDAVRAAWRAEQNPGHSDLDNEQPISLHVRLTLGDLRRLDEMYAIHESHAEPQP